MIPISLLTGSQNPADFNLKRKGVIEQTPAMLFGNALHSFLLEPDRFNAEYYIADTMDNEIEADGRIKDDILKHLGSIIDDKKIISKQWLDYFTKIERIIKLKGYDNIIEICEKKKNMYASYDVFSQTFKLCEKWDIDYDSEHIYISGCIDAFNNDIIIDIKSVSPNHFAPKKFYYYALDYGYIMRMAAYKKMLMLNYDIENDASAVIMVVSNDIMKPDVIMYRIDNSMLMNGYKMLKNRLKTIHNCLINDYFPILPTEDRIIYLNNALTY